MKWLFSPRQLDHAGGLEMNRGAMVPCHESPERAEIILAAMKDAGFAAPLMPADQGEAPLREVHDGTYVDFMKSVYADWRASGRDGSALPFTFPGVGMTRERAGSSIFARLGRYGFDAGSPIVEGTWRGAYWSAQTALGGADLLGAGERFAFSLCRPPGHHAGRAQFGGYCFFNNAALAVERLRTKGFEKVAVVDVDYHHGNGTQEIFWQRPDVLYGSIHADPDTDFPYFSGFADEIGDGDGTGATLNMPMPKGTDWCAYQEALGKLLAWVAAQGAQALVVSLGVDTWYGDPISGFGLRTSDFGAMGLQLGRLGLPVLVVMEGGYAVSEVGANVVEVLRGLTRTE